METLLIGGGLALAVGIPVTMWRYWQGRARKYQALFETEQALIQVVARRNDELKVTIKIQEQRISELHEEVTEYAGVDELLGLLSGPDPDRTDFN